MTLGGAEPSWWTGQSSKLRSLAKTRAGGFDSHTLPPASSHLELRLLQELDGEAVEELRLVHVADVAGALDDA